MLLIALICSRDWIQVGTRYSKQSCFTNGDFFSLVFVINKLNALPTLDSFGLITSNNFSCINYSYKKIITNATINSARVKVNAAAEVI